MVAGPVAEVVGNLFQLFAPARIVLGDTGGPDHEDVDVATGSASRFFGTSLPLPPAKKALTERGVIIENPDAPMCSGFLNSLGSHAEPNFHCQFNEYRWTLCDLQDFLGVGPKEVVPERVEARGRGLAAEAAVGSVVIVEVEPGGQGTGALR